MRLCLKFIKEGMLRFISHLELMRLFERALRRSFLPCSYSQGFNPHPLMSFASPLAVGIASREEYLEIQLQEKVVPQVVIEKLNRVLPPQVAIIEALELPFDYPSLMSVVRGSIYSVYLTLDADELKEIEEGISDLMKENEILIERKTKKGTRIINLKPLIYNLGLEKKENRNVLKMEVATGLEKNVRPDELLLSLENYSNKKISYNLIQREKLILES